MEDGAAEDATADAAGDRELRRRSEAYLDGLFGEGMGRRHGAFIDRLESGALRETLLRYHVLESDTRWLSVEENYLIGMCVLCAARAYGPAAMFARTLRHLGVPAEKILAAVARLTMWAGGVPAAEALGQIQRAIHDYDRRGLASMEEWFPPAPGEGGGD